MSTDGGISFYQMTALLPKETILPPSVKRLPASTEFVMRIMRNRCISQTPSPHGELSLNTTRNVGYLSKVSDESTKEQVAKEKQEIAMPSAPPPLISCPMASSSISASTLSKKRKESPIADDLLRSQQEATELESALKKLKQDAVVMTVQIEKLKRSRKDTIEKYNSICLQLRNQGMNFSPLITPEEERFEKLKEDLEEYQQSLR